MAGIWARAVRDPGVKWVTFGWTFFIAENVIISENRTEIIDRFGDDNYHLVYNTLSTLACGSFIFGYFRYGRNGVGASMNATVRSKLSHIMGFGMQTLGLIGFSQLVPKVQSPVGFDNTSSSSSSNNNSSSSNSYSNNSNNSNNSSNNRSNNENSSTSKGSSFTMRCPMDFKPKDVPKDGIYGTGRVSRHATLWSFGMTMAGEAFRTVYLAEAAMFAFPLLFVAIGTTHQDSRFRRGMGGWLTPDVEQVTSNIPFAALLTSKQSWSSLADEMKWSNAGIALGLAMLRAGLRR